MANRYNPLFDEIVERAKSASRPVRVAVAGADCENILTGLFEAEEDGFAEPILIGSEKKISETLEKIGREDEKKAIYRKAHGSNSVQEAIEMVQAKEADVIMRGSCQTRDFLLPILNKANHIIKLNRLLTHVDVLSIPGQDRLTAISDVTVLVNPSIEQRKQVIKNMVSVLKKLGITDPNIAILALVEQPSFHMRDSVEAQTIVKDHSERPIADCTLVGPISYDLIMSAEAARLKNYDCPYCGRFDGIVVPNLMTGNVLVKALKLNAHATSVGILDGATIPIAITSRSDSPETAYLSIASCTVKMIKKLV